MTQSTLILLRHGESLWNHENRFTGWSDVPLTERGLREADSAGELLMGAGIFPDRVSTSVLTRSIHTVWRVLEKLNRSWVPVDKTWRLNERHYGSLQGFSKAETTHELGEELVRGWRRTYKGIPPEDSDSPANLRQDPRYKNVGLADLPATESLEMTLLRVIPYWKHVVENQLLHNQTVLVVSHGNTLRALMKHLGQVSEEELPELHVPTGIPMLFDVSRAGDSMRYEKK